MKYLIGLVLAVLITAIFKKAIKKAPAVFYILAILYDAVLLYAFFAHVPSWVWSNVVFLIQNCSLALGFFTIVMFIGVLSDESALHKRLVPIRAELSILACLLTLGHIFMYARVFLVNLVSTSNMISVSQMVATIIAIALVVVLMLPLMVTSFKTIRLRMSSKTWKNLQKLAYPFFGLIYLHIVLFLLPAALAGSQTVTTSLAVYTVMFALYLVLRIRKQVRLTSPNQASRPLSQTP
jgi:DMSO/TMAO reductase YedYZ heme-binding membrane subunit